MFSSLFRAKYRFPKQADSVGLVRYLPADDRKGRVFIAGDLHGEFDTLISALHGVSFDFERDRVLFVGDLHDRGKHSAQCLDLLRKPWAGAVLGNHELMLLMAVDETGAITGAKEALEIWMANGGEWALDAPPQARAGWRQLLLENVPLYWIIERRDGELLLVCHAEPVAEEVDEVIAARSRRVALRALNNSPVLWGRRILHTAARDDLAPSIKDQLLPSVAGAYCSLHGHTCVRTATWVKNRLFLDTGAVLGNRLTIADADLIAPGLARGIYFWDIGSGKLLDDETFRLWPENRASLGRNNARIFL